jgi:hemerythrin-like domain-containing protein
MTRSTTDPVTKQPTAELKTKGLSPMDPPDAYDPPQKDAVPYEDLHPFLRQLFDEHRQFGAALDAVEVLIGKVQKEGLNKEDDAAFARFFRMLDEEVLRHQRTEDMLLFPLLLQRLLEHNEHSKGRYPMTAVDMMANDHVSVVQLSALAFNFMSLAFRLPDRASRLTVLDLAIEQSKRLHEALRLHIFREDQVIWGLAHKYLTEDALDAMFDRAKAVSR